MNRRRVGSLTAKLATYGVTPREKKTRNISQVISIKTFRTKPFPLASFMQKVN